ncbi:nucleotide-binding universal stress UspA family protein [Solirubrobacter pauli]|uniref:Nucleotide-binding universal stress UspA family protein n=2 Tax=Solirubrobacter pauli TaxID=166793 RepID=A0A660L5Y5_9ACTN|nr:nucleotide-binding universal stress UspA family protein [Solirubrobacter pauli]
MHPAAEWDAANMTDRPHPVLVGIDGTASGLEAVALGGALAVLTGSPVVLGAVHSFEGESWPTPAMADRWLSEAGQRLGGFVPRTNVAIPSTSPSRGLNHLAAVEDARLIVLGSSRHGPIGRVLTGSTTRRVTHGAPCAVAVAPHGWAVRSGEVPLVFGAGVTGAPEARAALALAAELAASARAAVHAWSVVHVPPPAHPMFAATSYEGWRRRQRRDAERDARELIDAVAPATGVELTVVEGDPVETLAAASVDLDLLVIGSRRYGPIRRVLLGGVSTPLIDCAHCPLVVVPRGVHADPIEIAGVGAVTHA